MSGLREPSERRMAEPINWRPFPYGAALGAAGKLGERHASGGRGVPGAPRTIRCIRTLRERRVQAQ
jgi:hypothetical protein